MQYLNRVSISLRLTLAIVAFLFPLLSDAQTPSGRAPPNGQTSREMQNLCANISASIEAERLSRQQKALTEIEAEIGKRLAALETKENEVSSQIERIESFEKKIDESLVAFYAGMKADAAAAQLSELEDDIAAGILLKLKTKSSSAILNEMQAARGAALIKRIGRLRQLADGKSP